MNEYSYLTAFLVGLLGGVGDLAVGGGRSALARRHEWHLGGGERSNGGEQ